MRSLQEAEEILRAWDGTNWQHPPGAPTAHHTTLHLTKAVFRALAWAQRQGSSADSYGEGFLREFFDEISGHLIEHSLRLCRTFGTSAADVLLADQGDGSITTIGDWANHHGEAAAGDLAGTFAALMGALEVLTDFQERQGHGESVDWRATLGTVPALMKAALGASVNFCEGEARFLPPFRDRLRELRQNEYASARA